MAPKQVIATEQWPGVYRISAPFNRSLNDFLKSGFRWFDYHGALGSKSWYLPEERLDDLADWCEEHGYACGSTELPSFDRDPKPRLPWNKHQYHAYQLATRQRVALLQWPTGAGKTLPAIALAQSCQRIIVVAPRSVISNWHREFAKWHPDAQPVELRSGRKIPEEQPHITLCSYGMLKKIPKDWAFDLLVYDELHNAMHAKSSRSAAAVALSLVNPTAIRIGLSATPVSVHMYDYWHQLHVLCPHRYGTHVQWQDRFHHVSRTGYQGARVIGGLRDDALDDYQETLDTIVSVVTQQEIAALYPPVTWRAETLTHDGKPSLPENLRAWQAEQTALAETRSRLFCDHIKAQPTTGKPYAVITYLRKTAELISQALGIPLITGEQPAHKRAEALVDAPAFVATMMSINEGLSLPRYTQIHVVESYPVPRFVEQVCGRFIRAYEQAPVDVCFVRLRGTSDEIITNRLCGRIEEQRTLYKDSSLRSGIAVALALDVDSEAFLSGLHESLQHESEESDSDGWE